MAHAHHDPTHEHSAAEPSAPSASAPEGAGGEAHGDAPRAAADADQAGAARPAASRRRDRDHAGDASRPRSRARSHPGSHPRSTEVAPAAAPHLEESEIPEVPATGLTAAQVDERVAAGRVNRSHDASSRSMWSILRANVFTLFNAIVGGSFLLLLLVGAWRDALFGFSAVANAVIGVLQEYRAKKSLDELALLNAPHARVVRDGVEHEIAREGVVPDDVIVMRSGDQVPADAVVVESHGLSLDEALLTGESDPVAKRRGDQVLSGSAVVGGSGRAIVLRVGEEAFAAGLTREARRFSLVSSEIRSGLNRVLRWITWLLAPVMLVVVNGQMQHAGGWAHAFETGEWQRAIVGAIGAAIAMVPLGLVLLTSIAFAVGAVKLARHSVLVQELPAVEGLARVDLVCFDKTGTLTEGVFEFDEAHESPAGAGESGRRGSTSPSPWRRVLAAMAADENANASARALGEAFAEHGGATPVDSVVFSSARKWSAFVFDAAAQRAVPGIAGSWVLGAPEIVLDAGRGDPDTDAALDRVAGLAAAGKRVMVLARAEAPIAPRESDDRATLPPGLVPHVLVTLRERIRDDARETIEYFRAEGVSLRVISGDDPRTVAAVARQVGLETDAGVDARTLPEDPAGMAEALERNAVFGRVTPEQKREMVKAMQANGHTVAMTGDGVNDILALKEADLGIAMGGGAAATRAVSRLVLLDGRFSHLPRVVAEGRQAIANVERVSMLFLSKTAYSFLIGIAFGALLWGFPFLPRQLSVLDGITLGLPGFLLALLPNVRRYQPGYLRRSLSFAIPTGVVVTLGILGVNLAARLLGADVMEARTASCLVLALLGLWILNVLIRPLDLVRWLLLVVTHVALVALMLAPIVTGFFEFRIPAGGLLGWTLFVAALGACALEALFRWHRRAHPGGHESSPQRRRERARRRLERQGRSSERRRAG